MRAGGARAEKGEGGPGRDQNPLAPVYAVGLARAAPRRAGEDRLCAPVTEAGVGKREEGSDHREGARAPVEGEEGG